MNLYVNKKLLSNQRRGVALIFTMIVLVLLTALVYRISSSVSQWKHRMQYMIDYQNARYACESGLKYALATVGEIDSNYVSRPNEPDFSDLFTMSDEEYKKMMQEWAQKLGVTVDANNLSKNSVFANLMNLSFRSDTNDGNNLNRLTNSGFPFSKDSNDINNVNDVNNPGLPGPNEPNQLYVHGPYGPPWPYVVKPVEIEFGDARVTIEIIDENAKLPLCWGISSDPNVKKETKAAIQTFCEWMQMEPNSVKPLFTELEAVREIKPFSINMQPVVTTVKQQTAAGGTDDPNSRGGLSRSRRTAARGRRARTMVKTTQQARPDIGHARDFAKLMHSPMIDIETLAKPVNEDENRTESALKYISLWGTQRVNINTAPRQVLESAFTFGGDSVEIAKQIIELRKEQPFTSVDELGKRLYSFYTSIDKAKPYITTTSDYFSIRVTATSGVAKVSATAGIKKDNKNVEQIGIIIE